MSDSPTGGGEEITPAYPNNYSLEYGEIAVNYASGHETLMIKNSDNRIIGFKSVPLEKGESGLSSIQIGSSTTLARGNYSFATGYRTIASGDFSHTEGRETTASTSYTHTEGYVTVANGIASHAEGISATTSGQASHAEGRETVASGMGAHAEGGVTTASGQASHAEGFYTKALNRSEHAEGQYNISHKRTTTFGDPINTIHSVGIGTGTADTKNAVEIMQNGDTYLYGVGGYDGTNLGSATPIQGIMVGFQKIVVLTQTEYNSLENLDATTLYVIKS